MHMKNAKNDKFHVLSSFHCHRYPLLVFVHCSEGDRGPIVVQRFSVFFFNKSAATCLIAANILCAFGVHKKGNNQPIQTQYLSENENQNHADEESGLLGGATYTSVTDDANSEARH